jgi:hypothetical protein
MLLDIQRRKLEKGFLVNSLGYICKLNYQNLSINCQRSENGRSIFENGKLCNSNN